MMVLVDTSVWIPHLRSNDARMEQLLREQRVLCHPFVVGELACGRLDDRAHVLDLLTGLEKARIVENNEVLRTIEKRKLFGRGIGIVDMHLLSSAKLSRAAIWSRDRAMLTGAELLGIETLDE
jgi:predicted nucleic acid-binding protein